jgi:hypothetical protein
VLFEVDRRQSSATAAGGEGAPPPPPVHDGAGRLAWEACLGLQERHEDMLEWLG